MKKNNIVILLFLCNFFWLNAQKSEIEQGNKHIDSAKKLRSVGKYIEAINVSKFILSERDTNPLEDALTAKVYSNIADDYITVRNLDSAKVYIEKGLDFLSSKNIEDSREKGLLYYSLGTIYGIRGDLNTGEKYFQEALQTQRKSIGENHYETASTYGNLANIALYKRDFNTAFDYLDTAVAITKSTLGENNRRIAGYYNNMGIIHGLKGEFKRALVYYEASVKIIRNNFGINHRRLNQPYYNLSSVYHKLGDFDKAIDYLKKAIRIREKIYTVKGYELGTAYTLLGHQYTEINKFEEALQALEKGLKALQNTYGEHHEQIAINYTNFCRVYRKMQKNDEAIAYGLKALAVFNQLPNKNYPEILSLHSNIAKAYINNNNFEQAKIYANKALAIFNKENIKEKGDTYLNLAKINILKNNNSLHEQYLDSAAKYIGYDRTTPEKFDRVTELDVLSYFFETNLLKFEQQLKHTKNQKYSDSIRITYQTFLDFQDYSYQKFSRRENKGFRIDKNHYLYENSILNILDRNREDEFLLAFEEAEKVKSRLLIENLNKQNAQKFANINDSLLTKEYDLEKKLSQLEQRKINLKATDSLLIVTNNEIFEVKNEKDKLQELIKTQHPEYYNLVYNQNVSSVSDMQQLLEANQSLVEYFVGKQHIFIFHITKTQFNIKKIRKDFPLKEWVSQLREGIYNYWAMPNASDADLKKYTEIYKKVAFQLYEKLLLPISDELSDKLIIIPDASLNFIPFDALLTADATGITNDKDFPFLIKKHEITYNYSATLYHQLKRKEESTAKNDVLAFAPKFVDETKETTIALRRNGLGALKYNVAEVTAISKLFDTNIFKDSLATKSNFIGHVKDHKIIHLSTHAKSNDIQGDYSFIAFSNKNDSLQQQKLYVKELYNLNLDADMVVLSACETGIGELKKGEGLISLARAFTYAGARSTVTSLWNVNDAQTTKLMTLFYTNLKNGMAKGEALHHAKLTYLKNENLSSPYFWAAFIPAGDMQKIDFNDDTKSYYFWIGGLLILLGLGFGLYQRRKAL